MDVLQKPKGHVAGAETFKDRWNSSNFIYIYIYIYMDYDSMIL